MSWLPINTAPKDKKPKLFLCEYIDGKGKRSIGYKVGCYKRKVWKIKILNNREKWRGNWVTVDSYGSLYPEAIAPKYWQPIIPPQESEVWLGNR